MAKTLEQILLYHNTQKKTQQELIEDMVIKQASYSELAGLDNTSASGLMGQIRSFVAYTCSQVYDLFVQQLDDVYGIVLQNKFGSGSWYIDKILAYQHGDNLVVQNGEAVYTTIDETKKIVKRVSLSSDAGGILRFWVWGEADRILTTPELGALTNYINQIRIIGTQFTVNSLQAISIYIIADVHKNSLLVDNTGKKIGDNTYPIPAIINSYLAAISPTQPFVKAWLEADIIKHPEVISMQIATIRLPDSIDNYVDAPYNGVVENLTGRFVLDPNSTFRYV